mgnify:CR=1 FL=1
MIPGHILKQKLVDKAYQEGFSSVGITIPSISDEVKFHLSQWIYNDYHGTMEWMERRVNERKNPKMLWPEVRSVIVLLDNYSPEGDSLSLLNMKKGKGKISVYARGDDYHKVMKKRMKRVGMWFEHETGESMRMFVDTAPVMEKAFAMQAGIGWQGKHTNLVSRNIGSWGFIGVLFASLDLPVDNKEKDHCGSCRRCIDICPTSAFPAPYSLDARRCISYLTIEMRGHIPVKLRPLIGDKIYGCDDCLAVCPWNKFAVQSVEARYHARKQLDEPDLSWLVTMDDSVFREVFSGSPIKRIGRDCFIRNVLIAIGNSGCQSYLHQVETLLCDSSPIVRAVAVWALSRIADIHTYRKHMQEQIESESDPYVLCEWRAAAL